MEIVREYGKFTCLDLDRGIKIIIQQISGKGYTKEALLSVEAKNDFGEYVVIEEGRNNISNVQSRDNFADRIERRVRGNERKGDEGMQHIFGINSPLIINDWHKTFRDACQGALKKHYQGKPPKNLYEDSIEDDDLWRIPVLLSEDTNFIYGNAGSGKSYLSIICGQAIQHGVPVCDLPTVQGNVLFIDYETNHKKMRRRFRRVDKGLDVYGDHMLYMEAEAPLSSMVDAVQDLIIAHSIDFIIVDSFARAVGSKITEEENVIQFFNTLKELDLPCLIVHHTNKADEYYGNTFIRAYARNLWRLRSVHVDGEQALSIQLEQEKENDGPSQGTLGFLLRFEGDEYDPDSVTLSLQDPNSIPEHRKYNAKGLIEVLSVYLEETPFHKMELGDNNDELIKNIGLKRGRKPDDSKIETLRTYIWDLSREVDIKLKKYKRLNELMHLDYDPETGKPKYLCLNTTLGNTQQTEFVIQENDDSKGTVNIA